MQNIEVLIKIYQEDVKKLDSEITEGEVSVTLKNTRNNVAPLPGGFGGAFLCWFLRVIKTKDS